MNLRNKILSDPINKWVFEHSENEVFLVGGYVRDLMMGREPADSDYAVAEDFKKLAEDTANKFEGRVIHISRYNILRVMTKKRDFVDFTPLESNIKANLQKRDFTINAIAWSPVYGLIDPLNGTADIKNKVIRVTNEKSIYEDPLRCLRAFRIAAELDFNINRETLLECAEYAKALSKVAEERKTDEIIKLLNNNNAMKYLELSLKHNVLNEVISLNHQNIKSNLDKISRMDNFFNKIRLKHYAIYKSLNLKGILRSEISQGMNGHCFLRIALLTYCNTSEDLHVKGLKLSNITMRRIKFIHSALRSSSVRLTQERLYRLLKDASECSEEVALIISMFMEDVSLEYLKKAQDLNNFILENTVNGHDIQREMNITSGNQVGLIKEEIRRKWFLGELKTGQQILSFIRSNLT